MRAVKFLLGGALVLAGVAVGVGSARASGPHRVVSGVNQIGRTACTGTFTAPGLLAGTYPGTVTVTGYCVVDGGAAVVKGDLRLASGAALNATFARNDVAGTGTSSLLVRGDVLVGNGATLGMGCEPNFSACSDDPAASTGGTLRGQNRVDGNLTAVRALGVIVHASHIKGDITQVGGGGGLSCAPPTTGFFSLLQSPVFSDYEDNSVTGSLRVTGLQSCYFGALRNTVHNDLTYTNNTLGDPDASEVLTNVVLLDLRCAHNSPAVQYGDSAGMPNKVAQNAFGECGFNVTQPNPSPGGPLAPIAVKKK
jgi:hypothetical protein